MWLSSLLVLVVTCLPLRALGMPQANEPTSVYRSAPAQTTAYTLPPDKLEKSRALYMQFLKLTISDAIYSFLILLALLLFGIAARYRDWAESVSGQHFVQALVFVPLLMITISLLGLPLRAYGHHVSLQYGLSIQGWGSWFGDLLKGEMLQIALAVVVLWILTTLIRKSPRRWWFYAGLVAVPILVFLTFVFPVLIDPLFNKFEPLDRKQPKLVDAIETVVQRGG
ncbi:MAG TPA: M48 family peptidase, partial [Candidatus Angelobacter sp.]|nr:M48 family peptidase [Candidatus Angelobacter sp.]